MSTRVALTRASSVVRTAGCPHTRNAHVHARRRRCLSTRAAGEDQRLRQKGASALAVGLGMFLFGVTNAQMETQLSLQTHDSHGPGGGLERKLTEKAKLPDSEEAISLLWEEMAMEDGMHWMPAMGAEEAAKNTKKAKRRVPTGLMRKKPLVSVCSVSGGCDYMEDDVFVSGDGSFVGVFDGHGGRKVAQYLKQKLYVAFESRMQKQRSIMGLSYRSPEMPISADVGFGKDIEKALNEAIMQIDGEVLKRCDWEEQGSTCVVVKIDPDTRTIFCANVGDSRAVLCRDGKGIPLSHDHKPDCESERQRIEALGGKVVWVDASTGQALETPGEEGDGVFRVNGNLSLSRSIGNREERPYIDSNPVIERFTFDPLHDSFIIVGSDGLWDVMENEEAVQFVRENMDPFKQLPDNDPLNAKMKPTGDAPQEDLIDAIRVRKERMSHLLVERALEKGSGDNVSVVVLWLRSDAACRRYSTGLDGRFCADEGKE
jgi:serine/threonine protein phosphatase PrpC